jgi:hypothetical protein
VSSGGLSNEKVVILPLMPLGVTGNTPDSGTDRQIIVFPLESSVTHGR